MSITKGLYPLREGGAVRGKLSVEIQINYIDVGPRDGSYPPVLLVHGLGANLHYWAGIIPELSRERRVVAIDIPGFGDSPAPAKPFDLKSIANSISQLANSLQLHNADLVGHSLGGLIVLLLAENMDIDNVVIVDGHMISAYEMSRKPQNIVHYPRTALGIAILLSGLLIPYRGFLARVIIRSRVGRTVLLNYLVAKPSDLNPGLLKIAFSNIRNRGTIPMLKAVQNLDVIRLMKNTSANIILCWGSDDPLLSDRDTAMAQLILRPKKTVAILNCGHWPMLERPAELARIIRLGINDVAD